MSRIPYYGSVLNVAEPLDANTIYQFNLQNNYVDQVSGNPDATPVGVDQVFIADAGPFGAGDYAFDPGGGTLIGQGTKGANFSADLGNDVDFTVEFWHYLPAARANIEFAHLIDFNNSGADFSAFQNKSGGSFEYGFQGNGLLENIGTAPADDTWHHYVMEWNAAFNRMLWAFDGNTQSFEQVGARNHTSGTFGIGMGNSGMAGDNSDWPGYIAHVRISDVLRYDLQNNATYTVPVAPFT